MVHGWSTGLPPTIDSDRPRPEPSVPKVPLPPARRQRVVPRSPPRAPPPARPVVTTRHVLPRAHVRLGPDRAGIPVPDTVRPALATARTERADTRIIDQHSVRASD